MADDWFTNVRKYAPDANENVVGKIVNYLGIALRNRDSSLVAFSDPQEVDRVRQNYLRKKLGLTEPDDMLNAGLDWVKGLMSDDPTKNRVTVYYLLAHYFGKLDLFGGLAGTSAASLGGSVGAATLAGLGAAGAATTASTTSPPPKPTPASTGASTAVQQETEARPAYAADLGDSSEGGGWPKWLTWLLLAAAVIALLYLLRSCMAEKPATDLTATAPVTSGELNTAASTNALTSATETGATAAVPAGAGVVSGEQSGKPMLTVYFDTGKSAVSNDMAAAAASLKSYLDAHPGSKLAVSGYNDPSGNAALNAELSKNRAQAVAAALKAAGVPEASVELVKPAETTTATVTPEQARRVEVTVQQ